MSIECEYCKIGKSTIKYDDFWFARQPLKNFQIKDKNRLGELVFSIENKTELKESVLFLAAMYARRLPIPENVHNGKQSFYTFHEILQRTNPKKFHNGQKLSYSYTSAGIFWELDRKRCESIEILLNNSITIEEGLGVAYLYLK